MMMREGRFAPTLNLSASDCAQLDYLQGTSRDIDTDHILCNNFAFGGINTSLLFRAV